MSFEGIQFKISKIHVPLRKVFANPVTNYIHLIDLKKVNRQNSYLKQLNTPFYYEIHAESYVDISS